VIVRLERRTAATFGAIDRDIAVDSGDRVHCERDEGNLSGPHGGPLIATHCRVVGVYVRFRVSDEGNRIPLLDRLYQDFLNNENSAAFVKAVTGQYTLGSLGRLARCGSRVSRRAAVYALGMIGDYQENAVLGCAMRDPDRAVRLMADHGIRSLWFRCGNERQRKELQLLARYNNNLRYDEVVRRATELIESAPWIPEAWNQRGVALFHLRKFNESADDCHQTLEINPYHFGAAVSMGHCYLEMNDPAAALECFRRALRLNPGLEGVRAQIEFLERSL